MAIIPPWPLSRHSPAEEAIAAVVVPAGVVVKRRTSISSLLRHYERPGVAPPSSRVDPLQRQQEHGGISLWDVCKFGALVAFKATELASDVLVHHIWGPRKKSWGIQMTVLTSIMRDAGSHSNLVDIATIRMFLSLGGLFPLPPDALVTPVTFRVRCRQLRGILAQFDALEDGTRELAGEWVVSKKLWQRLQADWRASRAPPSADSPPPHKHKERVILFLHGGAYYLFSPATHRRITIPLSKFTDARVFAVDYRLAPETRFPGPLHDAVSTYFRLIEDLHIPPENILFAGDSAGGGLCLALLMYLRDNQYPMPSGAILMSPWVDLTQSCDSWASNAPFDIVPTPPSGDHLDPVACYLGPHMERYLTHPYASPLFGDFAGLPPLLIQAGDAEVLRDEVTLLAHKATLAGVKVMHELYEDAIHVFQALPFLDATPNAFMSCRAFIRNVLPLVQAHSPQVLDGAAEAGLAHDIDNERARVISDGVEKMPGSSDALYSAETTTEEDEGSSDLVTDEQEDGESEEPDSQNTRTPSRWEQLLIRSPAPRAFSFPADSSDSGSDSEASDAHAPQIPRARQKSLPSGRSSVASGKAKSSKRGYRRLSPSTPQARRLSAQRHLRLSALSISTAPTPRPMIRSSASHPDISSLCAQWETSGPANRTLTYNAS